MLERQNMKNKNIQIKVGWKDIRFYTLSFIFIIAYVTVFPLLFGAENNIVAVIFTILMSASMVRDLTGTPIRHFFIQSFVLVWMAIASCLVNLLSPIFSLPLNFITLFVILYAFTYDYANHLYFPYILSYLFLIFISPVPISLLPRRLFAMLAGACSIMVYQWVMGRKKIKNSAQDILCDMIQMIQEQIHLLLNQTEPINHQVNMHHQLHKLSKLVYDRRKKVLCISDASFSLIDAGRGFEHLNILMQELPTPISEEDQEMLTVISKQLSLYDSYIKKTCDTLPELHEFHTANEKKDRLFFNILSYIRDRLLHMSDPDHHKQLHKSALSFKYQWITACNFSPVRLIYAVRIALVLSLATLFVQMYALPHGKWLLFTIASVSLPYADDVPSKMKKRVIATVIGGLISVVVYTLFPSSQMRMAIMMLSGYASFYFHDYAATFACSTIGALGGAVFLSTFGLTANLEMFLIRLSYIIIGAMLAFMFNCMLFPYTRQMATRALWKRYERVTELLIALSNEQEPDAQLYYSCIIQAHMLEEKLSKNAKLEHWTTFPSKMRTCRIKVYKAHRSHIADRKDATIFTPELY